METDLFVFVIIEGLLVLLFGCTVAADIFYRFKDKSTSITGEVTRGEKSMNALYVNFGIATVVFTLIVQTCKSLEGNQVLFIVVNYGLLTYLFFFSSWFRNQLFFPMLKWIRKDWKMACEKERSNNV